MITGTRHDLSNALGLSERRISQLVEDKIIPRPKAKGGYDLVACVRAYIDSLRKDKGTLTEERTLLVRAKRMRAELDLKQRAGELIDKFTVQQDAFACGRRVRDNFQNIPDRVSGICAAEQDQNTIHQLLTKEIHQVLLDVSTWGKQHEHTPPRPR